MTDPAAPVHPAVRHIMRQTVTWGASDIHLRPDSPPWVRRGAILKPHPDLTAGLTAQPGLFTAAEIGTLAPADTARPGQSHMAVIDETRWRVTVEPTLEGPAAMIRHIPSQVPALGDLALPSNVHQFANTKEGLIVIAGTTGSGKTTTAAALINIIAQQQTCHVLTLEDPPEYYLRNPKYRALVTQRSTAGVATADVLNGTLRSDPDVVLFGECRDTAQIEMCLRLAATGHLVVTTLHALNSTAVCQQIAAATGHTGRALLAQVLRGVICQSLIPSMSDHHIRVCAAEVLVPDLAIRSQLAPGGDMARIDTALRNHRQSMSDVLTALAQQGRIDSAWARSAL